ncbi:trypsin delta/gamma-like protein CG30031 [Scaptodrosophila lebanonensis]|uniref:trypsin n=1 Tax=Drosophila lebanonensis TaxID=7225 RepID=A0A6J2UL05_DROLE|nr:trypsin delta/gamma-like protein CG30031 [Scaptodrosophila lebanonensis]
MFKYAIILTAVSCILSATVPEGVMPQLDGRIVGGKDTTISAYPWQISLQRNNYHSCGGSVISSLYVVTAAHCLQDVPVAWLKVRAGSTNSDSGGSLIPVKSYKIHEKYSRTTLANDIGIIRLETALTLGPTIKAIQLASEAPEHNAPAVVSGWGTLAYTNGTTPKILQCVDVKMISTATCAQSDYGSLILPSMICASDVGKDACLGDSGGPLVSGGKLVGIVSWGYGCAEPNYPGVYTNVAALWDWVSSATNATRITKR